MEKVDKCIICNNTALTTLKGNILPFLKDRMFNNWDIESNFLYCPNCHVCFSEIRPSNDEASRYYQNYMKEEYLNHRKKIEGETINEYEDFLRKDAIKGDILKRKFIGELLERNIDISNIKNVLDFGGGTGALIPEKLEHANKYVYDIDNTPTIENVTKISKDQIKDKQWDLILCSEVLEHVSYPMDIIKEILEILPEGGYLCLDVPYEGKGTNSYIDDKSEPIDIHEHINKFRPYTLQKIFNSLKYVILEITTKTFYNPKLVCSEGITICLVKKLKKDENAEEQKLLYEIKNSLIEMQEKYNSLNINPISNNELKDYINTKFTEHLSVPTKKVNFLQKLFSITNATNHKVIRILGLKISFKYNKKHN